MYGYMVYNISIGLRLHTSYCFRDSMTYVYYAHKPEWGYELDAFTDDEEARQGARLHQLDCLLDFLANYGDYEDEFAAYVTAQLLSSFTGDSEWPFRLFPDVATVKDMYANKQHWVFSYYPQLSIFCD